MDFGLSEEQTALQDMVKKFLANEVPTTKVREVMDGDTGHDPAIWAGLAELGVLGLLVPEAHDGMELSLLDAALVAEELGRAATPAPYVECAIMSVIALCDAGTDAQQAEWLPKIAMGEAIVTIGGPSPNGAPPDASLTLNGDTLSGNMLFVPAANVADAIIVALDEPGGKGLYLVPRSVPGLSVETLHTIDKTRRLCELVFSDVTVTPEMRMGDADAGAAAYERALNAGRIAIVADGVGGTAQAIAMTLDYVKTREQFGRAVGSFQAVKHMCADMVAAAEPVRALMWYTAYAFDSAPEDVALNAPLAKAHMAEVGSQVLMTATECHGGIGYTEECDLQIFYKRAGLNRQLLGGPEANRALAAAAQGWT